MTDKQLLANRNNAKLAGVKTEDGKKVIRHNSFKHGMTAQTLISKHAHIEETEEGYLAVIEGFRASLRPQNYFEESLIESMAKAQFKLVRFDYCEAECLKETIGQGISWQITEEHKKLETFLKYKQSLEAQFYRALEYLHRGRQVKQMDLFGSEGNDYETSRA